MHHSRSPRNHHHRLVLLTAALSLFASCTDEVPLAEDESAAVSDDVVDRSQPQIIDHGDGTYEIALPPGASVDPHWVGPYFVEYDGQSIYSWDEVPWPSQLEIYDEIDLRDDVDMAHDMVIEDENHSRWKVVQHDQLAWDQIVGDYDLEMEQLFGPEELGPDDPQQEFSGWAEVHPFTWTETNCDGNPTTIEQGVWDTEDRSPFFSPPSVRMAKTVVLFRDIPIAGQPEFTSFGRCSGFMIDDEIMMTAQHCVVDAAGNPHPLGRFVACTQGNEDVGASCARVRSRARPLPFVPVDDTDWAMLGLRADLGAGNFMALSRARAGIVEREPAFNSGYPAHLNNACNNNPAPRTGGVDASAPHRAGFWHSDPDVNLTRTMTQTHLDGASGQSGSPIYYYPDGCCGRHFATGVLAGYRREDPLDLDDGWVTGPRISRIRRLVLSLVPVLSRP